MLILNLNQIQILTFLPKLILTLNPNSVVLIQIATSTTYPQTVTSYLSNLTDIGSNIDDTNLLN